MITNSCFPGARSKRVCYVLFVGNRGLCGVYNHAVLRYAQELVQAEARPCTVVVCGSWGKDIIRQSGLPVQHTFDAISDAPGMAEALPVADYLKRIYLSGQVDEIHLVYQQFCSALQQVPGQVQLLPARLDAHEQEEPTNDYIFEPDARSVLENMVQLYLNNMVFFRFAGGQGQRAGFPYDGHECGHRCHRRADQQPEPAA